MSLTVTDQNKRESPSQYLDRNLSGIILDRSIMQLDGYEAVSSLIENSGEKFRVAIIFKDKNIFQLVGRMEEHSTDFSLFDKQFISIISSFSKLEVSEKELSKALSIKLYKVRKGETYKTLASNSSIPFDPETKLRLLNGDYPNKELKEGRVIKIVQ